MVRYQDWIENEAQQGRNRRWLERLERFAPVTKLTPCQPPLEPVECKDQDDARKTIDRG